MNRRWQKILSVALTVAMLFSMAGMNTVFAAETGQTIGASGLCEHHPAHTDECGYTEGTPEAPCAHEHMDDCYKEVTECVHEHMDDCYGDEAPTATDSGAAEPVNCAHICDEDSGCVTTEPDCAHSHEDCGYVAAVPGTPCAFVCEECAKGGEPPAAGPLSAPPVNDALHIVSVSPDNGATDVALDTKIAVTFSQPVNFTTYDIDVGLWHDGQLHSGGYSGKLSNDSTTYTRSNHQNLLPNAEYNIRIRVTEKTSSTQLLYDTSHTFTTGAGGDTATTYPVTLNIYRDGAAETDSYSGTFILKLKNNETTTVQMTGQGKTRTASVPEGTWKVYRDQDGSYTGVDVTVIGGAVNDARVDLYSGSYTVTAAGTATGAGVSTVITGPDGTQYPPMNFLSGLEFFKGEKVELTATGEGADSYTYAWSGTHGGTSISGTGKTLTIDKVEGKVTLTCTVTGGASTTVTTADELKTALEATTPAAISVTEDIELGADIEVGADHTLDIAADKTVSTGDYQLEIPEGKTLTLTGTGTLEVNATDPAKITIYVPGTLKLSSGSRLVVANSGQSSSGVSLSDLSGAFGILESDGGIITISNSGEGSSGITGLFARNSATLTLTGGSLTVENTAGYGIRNVKNVNISGGCNLTLASEGTYSKGLQLDELSVTESTVNISNTAGNGLEAEELTMDGCTVTVANSGGNGIDIPPRREGGDFNLKDSTLTLRNTGGTGLNIGSYKKLIIDNATVTMEPTAPSGGRALEVGSSYASVVGMDSETLTLVEGVILNLGGIKIFNDRGSVYNGRDDVTVTAENGPATNETLTAGDYVWDGTCFAKGGGYDGDVAAFGAILDAHPSLVSGDVSRDDPESWINAGVTWQDYPKRITGLDLTNKGLTGTLDVSGLTALIILQCANNELTDLTGLGSLTKLRGLYCANNELTDLTGLGSLTELMILDCANNPYTTFTTKAGHTLAVVPGAGGKVWMTGYNMEDHTVELTARPDSGYTFQTWTDLPEGAASGGNTASFTLSATDVTVKAVFERIPTTAHTITFNANGGSVTPASAATGADGRLTSLPTPTRSGSYRFDGWYTAASGGTQITTATVFTADTTVYAHWTDTSGGGSGGTGDGGGSSSGSSTPTVTPPDPGKPDTATNAETKVAPTVNANGSATVTVPEKSVTDAIKAAQDAAKKAGTEKNGVSVTIDATTTKGASDITATLTEQSVDALIKAGVTEVRIKGDAATITLDLAALKAAQAVADGAVTVSAKPVAASTLSAEAQNAIGNRPVFSFTLQSGGKPVNDFGSGSAAIAIPYTPQKGEDTGKLCVVYVDDHGGVTYLTDSSYDPDTKALIARTGHFSVYGVGYKADAPVFTDTANHWAKADIDFVAARGLLSGTGNNQFSPDTGMTRGMFVTALYRLAGSPQAAGEDGAFTDVPSTAYYADAVKWAAEKGIVSGTTATTFAPDRAVTRQEMAVIMQNYAKALDYTVPKTREAVTFADNTSIGSWAKDAVKAMQMAGILNGKDGNRFDPQGTATRAEVAAVLHRYVELVIDPATAQGWDQNDSGV